MNVICVKSVDLYGKFSFTCFGNMRIFKQIKKLIIIW
jgi:hypothetical protein